MMGGVISDGRPALFIAVNGANLKRYIAKQSDSYRRVGPGVSVPPFGEIMNALAKIKGINC